MKKIFASDWFWKIYGFLFGPLELLIIYLVRDDDGKIGLFKLIGIMIALSFAYHIIPFIIRLLLKIVKIDFFDEDNQISTYFTGDAGLFLTWLPLLIYATRGESIGARIITIIFILPFILAQVSIFAFVDSIVHGDAPLKNDKENRSKSKNKISFTMTELIDKNGHSKTAYTLKNGNIAHTTVTNEFGNTEDEFTTIKHDL